MKDEIFAQRFRLKSIHQGGMANVLICQDIFNQRMIAVKTPIVAPERFSREARLWIGLGAHPNIVKAHLVQQLGDRVFLFMDFIGDQEGKPRSLRNEISRRRLGLPMVIRLGLSIVRALKHAQAIFSGFVHRDLKPENILVDNKGNFYVSDFGISHIPKPFDNLTNPDLSSCSRYQHVQGSTNITLAGSFIGTPGYAAPEQYQDSSRVDFRTDFYSLGVILFEVMTRVLPSTTNSAERVKVDCVRTLRETQGFVGEVFDGLWNLIFDLLQTNPENRPKSIVEVENSLLRLGSSYTLLENDSQVQIPSKHYYDAITLSNQVYSHLALGKNKLATRQLMILQRNFPWSKEIPLLTRKFVTEKSKLSLLKKLFILDISNPSRILGFLAVICFMMGSLSLVLPYQSLVTAFVLIILLISESYINVRSLMTLNKITYSGMLIGLVTTIMLDIFGQPILAGNSIQALIAAFLSFATLLGINAIYSKVLQYKEERALGAGTIKLIIMVSTFVGLKIFPIMLLSILIVGGFGFFVYQLARFQGELKWSKDRVCPTGYRDEIEVPTSAAILLATWIVLMWPLFVKVLS
jgi:serine/threonine protein kinase